MEVGRADDVVAIEHREVPAELKDAAVATARRRYTNWRRAVDDMVQAGGVSSPAPGPGREWIADNVHVRACRYERDRPVGAYTPDRSRLRGGKR